MKAKVTVSSKQVVLTLGVVGLLLAGLPAGALWSARAASAQDGATTQADGRPGEDTGSEAAGISLASAGGEGFCTDTATVQFNACRNEVVDDYFTAQAFCIQIIDAAERQACFEEANAARQEGNQTCREQRDAREDLCDLVGEGRYDPNFDPALFESDFSNLTHPNPYFPLEIGNHWEFTGGGETVTLDVLDETKLIEGVTCIVVRDVVTIDGLLVEDTDDWFGQRRDGTVDYCGEMVKDYETFAGDNPAEPELVDIAGSFKMGRDGLAGTQFLASPTVGVTYRQEFSPGNAEDAATVLSTNYSYGNDPELDEFVPQELAELLCAAGDCVVTREFAPLEPGVYGRKYYARGIGLFLEVYPETGDIVQLVDCNFDAICAELPAP